MITATPLWGSARSLSPYKMYATVVDKIACRSCTVCPPSIVLRLFIADTISSATICRQYVKSLRTRQKHGKFSCHNCKLERQIITQVCGFCQPQSWMVSCPTVHSDDQPVSMIRKSVHLHRHNDAYKVACSGKSYFSQMHRNSIANSN